MKRDVLISGVAALLSLSGASMAEAADPRPGLREDRPRVRQLQPPRPQQALPPLMEVEPRSRRMGPVENYGRHRLRPPPRGFAWVRTPQGFALVSTTDGRVYDTIPE